LSSGPTTPDHSTNADAREVLKKYDLTRKLPASVNAFFERGDLPESPGNKTWRQNMLPKLPRLIAPSVRTFTAAGAMFGELEAFRDSVFEVLLSSHDLVEAARRLSERAGFFVAVDNSCDDWDYADAARYLLERFHEMRRAHKRFCLISVGEVTVTMNRTPGAGGRNQQFALQCALDLAHYRGELLTVLSAGSDGIDGNTQNAGAIADTTTVERARAFGFEPEESLRTFNTCPLFTSLGDAIVTGPTGHNLRDLRLLMADNS
jgi:hydroxypyruvate reductase